MKKSLMSRLEGLVAESGRKDLVVLDTLKGLHQGRSHEELLQSDFDNPLFARATGRVLQGEGWKAPWQPHADACASSRFQREGEQYVAKLVWGSELSDGPTHIMRTWELARQRRLIPLCMSHVLRLLTLRQLPEEVKCLIPFGERIPQTAADPGTVPGMAWDTQRLVVKSVTCNEYWGRYCLFAEEVEFPHPPVFDQTNAILLPDGNWESGSHFFDNNLRPLPNPV